MAVGMWRSVDNVARKIKKRYRGVDNVTRTMKKRWRSVDNVARLTFRGGLIASLEELPSNSGVEYSIQTGTYDGYNQNLGYTKRLRIRSDGSVNEFIIHLYGDFAGKSYSFAGQSGSMWSYFHFFDANGEELTQTNIKYTSQITTASGTVPSGTEYMELRVVTPDDGSANNLYLYELMVDEYDLMEEMIDILNVSS